jgi:hypothetical protein
MAESRRPQPYAVIPLNGYWAGWSARAARHAPPGWASLVREMADLQDAFAAAAPPQTAVTEVRDYRSVTPLDEPLTVEAHVAEVNGRKLYLAGTLRHGDLLCAEATALFLTLRPEQT